MKYISYFLLLLFLCIMILVYLVFIRKNTYFTENKGKANLVYDSKTLDFGEIEVYKTAKREIYFSNEGKTPLIIYDIKSNCGCTKINWDKEPVHNKKQGKIQISIKSNFSGYFNKSVYIFSNNIKSPDTIRVKAEFI